MEQENADLRAEVRHLQQTLTIPPMIESALAQRQDPRKRQALYSGLSTPAMSFAAPVSHEAVASSLLNLKHGIDPQLQQPDPFPADSVAAALDDVSLKPSEIQELYEEYFQRYHSFLPLLEETNWKYYYELSRLLFWTVIIIATRRRQGSLFERLINPYTGLLWSTISKVSQNYHDAKALCLLCTWPLPVNSTSKDPTYMLSGIMMKLAMQTGLHRPTAPKDFSKIPVHVRQEDIRDRLRTWIACNVVSQQVSTAYGVPPETLYDSTLDLQSLRKELDTGGAFSELLKRLEIERVSNKVTKLLYSKGSNITSMASTDDWAAKVDVLLEDVNPLVRKYYRNGEKIPINSIGRSLTIPVDLDKLHVLAVYLHVRLSHFFNAADSPDRGENLLDLYRAAESFLKHANDFHTTHDGALKYATNYLFWIMLAGGFTLFKLLSYVDGNWIRQSDGNTLFVETVYTIREMSVAHNDLRQRLAEVLTQLWRAYGPGTRSSEEGMNRTSIVDTLSPGTGNQYNTTSTSENVAFQPNRNGRNTTNPTPSSGIDSSLQLKVRSRMSMSIVYDSVWRWREDLHGKISDSQLKNPTSPETAASTTTTPANFGNATDQFGGQQVMGGMHNAGSNNDAMFMWANAGFGNADGGDLFSSLDWVFDASPGIAGEFGDFQGMLAGLSGGGVNIGGG